MELSLLVENQATPQRLYNPSTPSFSSLCKKGAVNVSNLGILVSALLPLPEA